MKNRIIICWLLLLTLLYTQCLSVAVGPAYARYDSAAMANALVEPKKSGMTSNCMIKKGDPSMTVLLGTLEAGEKKEASFWLKSCGSDAVGQLLWSTSNPAHLDLVQITMKIDSQVIDPGATFELMKDVPLSFDLTISPSAIAVSEVRDEETKILVVVTWGDEMWGTFQVILPGDMGAGANVVSEDPDLIPEEENKQDEGNGESASTSIADDPEMQPSEPEESTPSEPSEPEESTPSEPSELEESTPSEPSEPEESTPSEPSEPENKNEDVPETEEKTENEGQQETKSENRIETLSRFDPSGKLPVKLIFSEDITYVRLGLQVKDGEEVSFEPFPDCTMFSRDQGKSYYMRYDGIITKFSAQETLLLDFSHTDLKTDEPLVLAMEAYVGDTRKETYTVEVMPDAQESCLSLEHPLNIETQAVLFAEGDTREAAAEEEAFGWPSRTLSQNTALEFVFPMEWWDAEVEYSVDLLTMTEDQTLAYVPVTLSKTGLYATYMDYDLTHNLVFRVGEILPQAGTYRLNMKWSYEGICFCQTQTTFFINYTADTAQMLGS